VSYAHAEKCAQWAARAVSLQGLVETRRSDEHRWQRVVQKETFCGNNIIHTRGSSRIALELSNQTLVRLDQNSTIVLPKQVEAASWLDLLQGSLNFLTRTPHTLSVQTPYLNASVEGTEFTVVVTSSEAQVSVTEGRVRVTNAQGELLLINGQSASAREGEAPVRRLDITPEDAVQWSLYYPSVIDQSKHRINSTSMQPLIATADQLLAVGRVNEARALLNNILQQSADNAPAHALLSIIALTQNHGDKAMTLALAALTLDPTSAAAAIALSYAQQAKFDLHAANDTLHTARRFTPDNSLLLARQAELLLSLGDLERAEILAQQALELDPTQAHALTMLGFAHLAQFEVEQARGYFKQAIRLNQADPLPRLGHGLAVIRNGQLTDGRREIEIAASLNPTNALIRSYLGKAYYEEQRNALAGDQFILAKSLDPLDPTPWFYDAIRKQTLNRPVEALQDLQQSIRLNDNRAIYRSRLLLDQDHAARSSSLARIYNDLGFSHLALSEGWKSISTDPSNHSAHRLLADAYSALPRHEIARVSELLQAQLLQPLNLNPIQPQLAASSLGILDGAGPTSASANEFNPLFTRNRFSLQINGIAASQNSNMGPITEHSTRSIDLVHSGIWGRYSYSLGTFHDDNQGIRPNHDRDREIDNLFIQAALDHNTSVQFEYRNTQTSQGDLPLRYDPQLFSINKRTLANNRILRLGVRHNLTPNSLLLFSAIRNHLEEHSNDHNNINLGPPFGTIAQTIDAVSTLNGRTFELQHQLSTDTYRLISGIGSYQSNSKLAIALNSAPPFCPSFCPVQKNINTAERHHNGYLYSHIDQGKQLTWTLGVSIDDIERRYRDDTQINPKLGLTWHIDSNTTLRAAAFRSLKRSMASNQTLEPTHIAGFNQFYDDINGTESRRYGIALETKNSNVYSGIAFSRRDLTTLFYNLNSDSTSEPEWQERSHRIYLYWTPLKWLTTRTEYQYDAFDRPAKYSANHHDTTVGFPLLRTYQLPFSINFFSDKGSTIKITATHVNQTGTFYYPALESFDQHAERFWTVDASISFRLKNQAGSMTVGANNLLDKNFRYHNIDNTTHHIMPERIIYTALSLSL